MTIRWLARTEKASFWGEKKGEGEIRRRFFCFFTSITPHLTEIMRTRCGQEGKIVVRD